MQPSTPHYCLADLQGKGQQKESGLTLHNDIIHLQMMKAAFSVCQDLYVETQASTMKGHQHTGTCRVLLGQWSARAGSMH